MLGEETDTAHCHDWYTLMQAAKYLGCKPWELLKESVYWRDKAIIAMSAERQAQEIIDSNKKQAKGVLK